jgi:hypothetical protein
MSNATLIPYIQSSSGTAGMFLLLWMQGTIAEESGVRDAVGMLLSKTEKIIAAKPWLFIANGRPHRHLSTFCLNQRCNTLYIDSKKCRKGKNVVKNNS